MPAAKLCLVGNLANLGDAFIAQTLVTQLRSAPEQARTVVLAPYEVATEPMRAHFASQGVPIISMKARPWRFLIACIRMDLVVGGGHVVREAVSLRWLALVSAGCVFARVAARRISLVGCGATPLVSFAKRSAWRAILRLSHICCVRDRQSQAVLRSFFPALSKKVILASDIAFLSSFGAEHATSKRRVCIVSPAVDRAEERGSDPERLLQFLKSMHARGAFDSVHFVAHDVREEFDGAFCTELAHRTRTELGIDSALIPCRTVTELEHAYASAVLIVTGRLHGLIMGALAGRPVLYFSDAADKLDAFAVRFGYPAIDLYADVEQVTHSLVEYQRTYDPARVSLARGGLRLDALLNFAPAARATSGQVRRSVMARRAADAGHTVS